MAGLAETPSAEGDDFWGWRETMYRFVGALGPDDVEAIAAQAYAEMLEAGFTRVGEFHYLHNDLDGAPYADPAEMARRIVGAASAAGIGLTLLPVFYARGGFGARPASGRQARFLHTPETFERLVNGARGAVAELADGRFGIAPHSLRAVSAGELAAIVPLADGGPIHIHVAEQDGRGRGVLGLVGRAAGRVAA